MATDNSHGDKRYSRHKSKDEKYDRHRDRERRDKYDKHSKKYDKYEKYDKKDEKRKYKKEHEKDTKRSRYHNHKRKKIEYEKADYHSKSKDKYIPSDLSLAEDGGNPRVYVSNLNPQKATIENVAELFGQIGRIKTDKRNFDEPKIKFYFNDKREKSGDCTITYDDCHTAPFAITWFNNTQFLGNTIKVEMAQAPKTKEQYLAEKRSRGGFRGRGRGRNRGGFRGGFGTGRGGNNGGGARGGYNQRNYNNNNNNNNNNRSRSRSRSRNSK